MSCLLNNGRNSNGCNSNGFNSNGFNSNGFNSGNCNSNGLNSGGQNQNPSFVDNLRRYIGETVTCFTTSGGASGCGFTGILLSVNQSCLRLVTDPGPIPANPLSEGLCGDMTDNCPGRGIGAGGGGPNRGGSNQPCRSAVGSVCDIPLNCVAAVCHSANAL